MDWLKYHNYAISGAVYTCRLKLGHVDYGTVCRAVSETWLDLQQIPPDEAASVTARGVQRMAGASVARTVREDKRWQSRHCDLSLAKRVEYAHYDQEPVEEEDNSPTVLDVIAEMPPDMRSVATMLYHKACGFSDDTDEQLAQSLGVHYERFRKLKRRLEAWLSRRTSTRHN